MVPSHLLPWYAKLGRVSLFWIRNKHKDKTTEQRFRLAIEALGPVFIKFGQMLSTRRDLLSLELAQELSLLQDKVTPFQGEIAQQLIIDALGIEVFEAHFTNFDLTPLASASIAQVHTATLINSTTDDVNNEDKKIVIKVLRPEIKKIILADLNVMSRFAHLVVRWFPDGKRLRPKEVVEEYRRTILDELDLNKEADNAIRLKHNFEQGSEYDKYLYVPEVYSQYSHENVMVMERIYGVGIGEIATLNDCGTNMKLLAERGVEVFFTQVFRDSFFHADMHPGNVFVDVTNPSDPTWIAIDCGIVGTLNKEDKRYLAENFVAFFNQDYRKVAQLHVDSGWVPAQTNVDDFEKAIEKVCAPIFNKPLAEISFGHVLVNLFNTARKFDMEVQPQLVLLQKTLLYIEGLGRQLYPQLDLWKTAKPFLENWVREEMGIKAVYAKIKTNLPFWGEKLPELPDLVYDFLKSNQKSQVQQATFMAELSQQQQLNNKRLIRSVFAGSTLICSIILFSFGHPLYSSVMLAVSALLVVATMQTKTGK
jgi:ubiquinone biosynthesis protein